MAGGIGSPRRMFREINFIWSLLGSDCWFCQLSLVFDFLMCDDLGISDSFWVGFWFSSLILPLYKLPQPHPHLWYQVASWMLCPTSSHRKPLYFANWTSSCPCLLPIQVATYIKPISGYSSYFWACLDFVLFCCYSLYFITIAVCSEQGGAWKTRTHVPCHALWEFLHTCSFCLFSVFVSLFFKKLFLGEKFTFTRSSIIPI